MKTRKVAFLVVVGILIVAVCLWRFFPSPVAGSYEDSLAYYEGQVDDQMAAQAETYDWEQSRRNLEHLGSLIQAERSQHKIKPQAEWSCLADAGLTMESLYRLLRSLPEEMRFVDSRRDVIEKTVGSMTYVSQYQTVIGAIEENLTATELSMVWTKRGEDLPLVVDSAMYSSSSLMRSTKPYKVLVLRLGGRVDEVMMSYGQPYSPARKALYLEK